jgi:hypothetical protein
MVVRSTVSKAIRPSVRSTLGSGGAGGAAPLEQFATDYQTAVNAVRSGADMSDAVTRALSDFIKSLKGTTSNLFSNAVDVWDSVRILAFTDAIFGVGEGTVVIPVVGDDGSGNPVSAADANQEDGTMISSAPWSEFHTTSQYPSIPFPSASFDYSTYTLCALLDTGASTGFQGVLSVDVTAEDAQTTTNTSEWWWFASDRLDGMRSSNRFGQLVNYPYMLQRMVFVRESLSTIWVSRNGFKRRMATLPSTGATTPTAIFLGHATGFGAVCKPYSCVLFDSVLSHDQTEIVTKNLDILRASQDTGAESLKITQSTSDLLLLTAATSDTLLIEAA